MQNFTPCLWFAGNAEEAAQFYTSIFKNSKIKTVTHYGESAAKASGMKAGNVLTVNFELDTKTFMALNGPPLFKFNESISFIYSCKTQEELDAVWSKLSAHEGSEQCGWLKDKFGMSWQIVPEIMNDMMRDGNPKQIEAVMKEVMQMKKLDIATLQRAFENA